MDSCSSQVSAENTVSDVSPPAPQVSLHTPIPDCQHHPPAGRPEGRWPLWKVASGTSRASGPRAPLMGTGGVGSRPPVSQLPSGEPSGTPPHRMAVLTVLHQPPLLSSPQVFLAKERNSYMMSQCSMQRRNLKHTWCLPTPTLPGMEPPSPKLPRLVLKTINNKRCTRDFSNSILLICFLLEHNASQCVLVSAEHKRAPCAHISAASALPPSHPLGHRRAPGRAPWPIAASQ